MPVTTTQALLLYILNVGTTPHLPPTAHNLRKKAVGDAQACGGILYHIQTKAPPLKSQNILKK